MQPDAGSAAGDDARARMRVDQWLWFARFFKTRALATKMVGAGKLRLNGRRISKPAQQIGPGDTLTFPQGDAIRVVRVLALAERRGPASEAQTLYAPLDP